FFVALVDRKLQEMFRQRLHRPVGSAERLNAHRGFLRAHTRQFILRCLDASSKKGLLRAAEHRPLGLCSQFSRWRRERRMPRTIPMAAANAIIQGARNASATPIMRTLHINAVAPCSTVCRMVAAKPEPSATRFPWE